MSEVDKKLKHKIKLAILGDQGVGKTNLISAYFENSGENINCQSKQLLIIFYGCEIIF
jgi:GTPase SAR1 family protein